MSEHQPYALPFSETEVRRLIVQSLYWADITEDLLRRAGIGAGMHVLDIGSGVGDVAMMAARLVGPRGAVLGIDRSAESLAIARRRADAAGFDNLRFEVAAIDGFVPGRRFDALTGRLVLLHQPEPAAVLRRLIRLLVPSGIVAFQEPDLTAFNGEPATPFNTRFRQECLDGFGRTGLDLRIGAHLPRIFVDAGLPVPHAIAVQRLTTGADSPDYEYMPLVYRSLLPLMLRFGITTAAAADVETIAERFRTDSVAHDVVWSSIRMVGAWARVPAG